MPDSLDLITSLAVLKHFLYELEYLVIHDPLSQKKKKKKKNVKLLSLSLACSNRQLDCELSFLSVFLLCYIGGTNDESSSDLEDVP